MESSSFGRLIGVLFSPVKTFQSIAERPTWGVALVVMILGYGAAALLAGQRTDYRDMFTQQMRDSGREASEAQLEQQVEMMEKAGPAFSAIGAAVFVSVIALVAALIYWLVFKLLGSEFSYKASLSTVLHAGMPGVLSMLLSIPVILSFETIGYDQMKRSGGKYLQSSLAFLAPEDAPSWLIALYSSVDVFAFWGLALSVVGYQAVSRLSTKAVAATVIVIWLLFVALGIGLASLF
jgi:hypothetical protein